MFHCPDDRCLFHNADWEVWAAHVRGHGRITCSVAGCSHVFKEQRVFRRHFVRSHTEEGRFRCSACTTVFKSSQTAVKHCKTCKKNGKPVPVDVKEGDDAVEGAVVGDDAAEEAAAGGGAAATGDAAVVDVVAAEGAKGSNVEAEVDAALAHFRAPLVEPLSPLREAPVFLVSPVVRVDVHLLAVVPNGKFF